MIARDHTRSFGHGSLLTLLHPRGQNRLVVSMSIAGLLVGWLSVTRLSVPVWGAILFGMGMLAYPAARKWQADRRRLGTPAMVLSILLVTQGLHTVEHVAQWIQYHLLGWPLAVASGLISPLNAEVVHFVWNLAVLLAVVYLLKTGFRNRWMWLLLIWATAHSAVHTYMFINYLQEVQRLASAGLPLSAAQGLPGFFGQGGWLATNKSFIDPVTFNGATFLCSIAPSLTTAPRLDVHFWWNIGEIVLLLPAAHVSARHIAPVYP
jgi:hypothetical protein